MPDFLFVVLGAIKERNKSAQELVKLKLLTTVYLMHF